MNDQFVPRIGGILSADIAVPQHEREMHFYSRVLGTGKNPLWHEDLMNNLGMPIIGLGAESPDYPDLPLQWMPHIQVADIAQSVASALELGGSEVLHGKDADGKSRWAVVLDPNGAAFGLIPVVTEYEVPSTEGVESIGCIAWLDLTVGNAFDTRDFYQQVVGWTVQEVKIKDDNDRYSDFNMLGDDGKPAAGICHARGVNLDLPPVWLLYLPVGDLTESLRRVKEEGGKIIKKTMDGNGKYTYAVIQDPLGVYLSLVQG